MISCLPIAHLHGGEATEGLIDESIRHSVTKMSQLHFVATKEYRKRVIQLGEHPDSVFLVGGVGIDNISRLQFIFLIYFLQKCLDFEAGGDLAKNLFRVYEFARQAVLDFVLREKGSENMDKSIEYVTLIVDGWNGIEDSV